MDKRLKQIDASMKKRKGRLDALARKCERERLEPVSETVQAEVKRVRVRLDFAIVYQGGGLPDFFGTKLLDFIEAGLQKTVPEAVAILPGSRIDVRLVRERKGSR